MHSDAGAAHVGTPRLHHGINCEAHFVLPSMSPQAASEDSARLQQERAVPDTRHRLSILAANRLIAGAAKREMPRS